MRYFNPGICTQTPLLRAQSRSTHEPPTYRSQVVKSPPNGQGDKLTKAVVRSATSTTPQTMIKKLKRNSPAQRDLRQMATNSKSLCHEILAKVKNSRQRRLKIRRLKYTCQAMIPVGAGDWEEERKSVGFDNKEKEVHESMKISLSLMSTEEEEEDRSLVRNDAVLAVYEGDECEDNGDVEQLSYGSVSLIGSRKEMEDAVSIKMGLLMTERVKCDFFAVYDGHGGPQVAKACRERLHRLLAEEVKRHKRTSDKVDWEGMMEVCFAKMDREVADNAAVRTVGSTALVMVVAKDQIVVANCGDCRAVMARGGEAFALSNDHKPDRPDELMRIEAAGGRVINWNGQRVLGVLATSRSIGDQYLRPYVISKPEVTVTKRTDKDEFLVLGSDGLWDVISNEAACQVVRKYLSSQITKVSPGVSYQSRAAEAAALLAELAMTKGSRDNTSVIVVELRNRNI